MVKFPSTTLPITNNAKDNQRSTLDLLDKINRVAASIPGGSGGGIKSVSADYTFTARDGIFDLFVTTGSATITVMLDKSSRNVGRVVRVWKADAGTGEVKIVGMNVGGTAETISGYTNVYAGLQYQHADIYQDGTTNFNVGQYIQPVAGELSLGTLHPHLATDDNWLYTNTTPAANTWYEVDFSSIVSAGSRLATPCIYLLTAGGAIYWASSNSETVGVRNIVAVPIAGAACQCFCRLNSSGKGYIAVGNAASDIYISKGCLYGV